MKYILMMNTMKAGCDPFPGWPKEDIQGLIGFMKRFDVDLKAEGVLVSAEGLDFPEQARLVRAGKNGEPITDGVSRNPRNSSPAIGSSTWRPRSKPTKSPPARPLRPDSVAHR